MSPRLPRFRRALLGLAAPALFLACSDASVMDPTADAGPGQDPGAASAAASGPLAEIGRGLALALDDAPMRQQVLEDMRDSPFPEHSLHLQSYLTADEGGVLAQRAAEALGISAAEFRGLLEGQPDLQLFMPSTLQRGTWKGEGPVSVIATLLSDDVLGSGRLPAWTSDGKAFAVSPTESLASPTLAVFPARHDFGERPGAALREADERDRPTVAREGALPVYGRGGVLAPGEVEDLQAPAASDGDGYAPGEAGLREWMTWINCRLVGSTNDLDADGLIDNCEEKLARAFHPFLWFHWGENHESRETYWAVRVQDFSQRKIFIFYALGYHDDHDPSIFDGTPFGGGHVGDSEWIQLRIVYRNGRWKLLRADYSAHFNSAGDDSRTYFYSHLDYSGRYRGRPTAYVAHGKHAAYNTINECEDAILPPDVCAKGFRGDVAAVADRNLGGLYGTTQPLVNCVDSQEGTASDGHSLPGTECIWSGFFFDGWHGTSDGTSGYEEVLEFFKWKTRDLAPGSSSPNPCPDDDDPVFELPECS